MREHCVNAVEQVAAQCVQALGGELTNGDEVINEDIGGANRLGPELVGDRGK
jgi:hypothetical protein